MTVRQGIHVGTALKIGWKGNQFLDRKWSEQLMEVNSSGGPGENILVQVVTLSCCTVIKSPHQYHRLH